MKSLESKQKRYRNLEAREQRVMLSLQPVSEEGIKRQTSSFHENKGGLLPDIRKQNKPGIIAKH